jgi:hypothetical protein
MFCFALGSIQYSLLAGAPPSSQLVSISDFSMTVCTGTMWVRDLEVVEGYLV